MVGVGYGNRSVRSNITHHSHLIADLFFRELHRDEPVLICVTSNEGR
jgi:hypothetical protein